MYWQLDVRRYSTGLCVICLLCNILIDAVRCNKSQFILPALPETSYTLDDVIILPENKDFAEASLLTTETSSVLSTINVTLENGFRLGNVCTVQNASIESGLQIITSRTVTVLIQLPTGLLHLPSVDDYATEYHILTTGGNLENNRERYLFIQSKSPNTSVTLCIRNYEADEIYDKFTPFSHKILLTPECTRKNISASEKLLLNNTSMLQGIEITSNRPVSILEGYRPHSSSLVRNRRYFRTPENLSTPISWTGYIIPLYKDWSNQFVLIPSQDRREVKLWIMSVESTYVDVVTDMDKIQLNLTANKPTKITVPVREGATLMIAGNTKFILICDKNNEINCQEEFIPVNVNYTINYHSVNDNQEYQWTYILNGSTVTILCPSFINVGLNSSNGTAEYTEEITMNILNETLLMKYFTLSPEGLYKLSVNNSLLLCSMSDKRSVLKDTYKLKKMNNSVLSSPGTPLNTPGIVSTVSARSGEISTPSTSFERLRANMKSETTESIILTTDVISSVSNITNELNTEGKLQTTSASPSSVQFSFDTTNYKTSNSTFKLKLNNSVSASQSRSVTVNKTRYKKKENALNNGINDRFKAVVEILHTRNRTVNTLISQDKQSNKRKYPTYVYRLDINDGIETEDDGKNPMMVIVSLVSALVAVGAIILIFLLKEFFSRRQQLRNTRIRPFISYY